MSSVVLKVVAFLLALALPITSSCQQASPALSRNALAVKRKADQLAPQAKISVVRRGAEEEFGTFQSNNAEEFTFYDVDLKMPVTLPYEAVKKIKDGYGGYNAWNHRHVDRTRELIVVAAVVGVLITVVIASAKS